ncbi:MAG: hypothetical protein IJ849_11440 [Selenomonadaceae bacterium]|nr:hypothetical protein [Selenomonadaceae bacterium]
MEKRSWDEYETAKLIELRDKLDDLNHEEQEAAIAEMSATLQKYVLGLGATKEFAEAKRGVVRIKQQLGKVEYVLTDGRAGVKTTAPPVIHAATLFKEDKLAYWELLQEANRRMGFPTAEAPIAWVVGAEKACLSWEKCELAALLDMYFRLRETDSSKWDDMMQAFSDKLACYQEGKRDCTPEILIARDFEHVGDLTFLLRMMINGSSAKSLGAPPLLEEILFLMERQPWAYEELLAQAKERIPGLA